MTKDFEIKSVAIVGGGPGGLASLNEFLHTNVDGTSEIGSDKQAENPAFKEVTLFEQKPNAGGIWAAFDKNKNDYDIFPQNILESEKYNEPEYVDGNIKDKVPKNLGVDNSYDNPLVERFEDSDANRYLKWLAKSGVYDDLFTNIPAKFTRFSYLPDESKYKDEKRVIYPFLTRKELAQRVADFVQREKLDRFIRYNSTVSNVVKVDNKWEVTVREVSVNEGKIKWYKQLFDAVVIANGHYTIPYVPHIKGLAEYNTKNPGSLLHLKSYLNDHTFDDKKVLFVGGGISTTNILQYAFPRAKQVFVAKRSPYIVFPFIDKAIESEGINVKSGVKEFLPDKKGVEFEDGSVEADFDLIVFGTGYHYHFPFISDEYFHVENPSNLSRVTGLYLDVFSIKDPTIATVGLTITHLNFHSIEASAVAIAGVWSNAKKLPSKEIQEGWIEERLKKTGNSVVFHMYFPGDLKPEIVDKLSEYAPRNRKNPLEDDIKDLDHLVKSFDNLEALFYRLKEGKITVEDTITV